MQGEFRGVLGQRGHHGSGQLEGAALVAGQVPLRGWLLYERLMVQQRTRSVGHWLRLDLGLEPKGDTGLCVLHAGPWEALVAEGGSQSLPYGGS